MKKRLLFLFIIVGALICLTSCSESYIVTFDPNGTEMVTEKIKVEYGEYYILPTPHRLGYGFLGWYNGEERVEDSGIWEIEGDVDLVAKWEFLQFEITCDVDGDGVADRNYSYNANSEKFDIEDPSEYGKIFSHWVDENGNTYDQGLSIPKGSEGSLKLTAVWWNYIKDNVIYEYNGQTLSVAGYNGTFNKDIFVPSDIFGIPVVGIKAGAFEGLEKYAIPYGFISRVFITRSITYIGENAFKDCRNIKVALLTNYDNDSVKEITKWLQGVDISPVGNDDLIDVLTLKRPAIGSSIFQELE